MQIKRKVITKHYSDGTTEVSSEKETSESGIMEFGIVCAIIAGFIWSAFWMLYADKNRSVDCTIQESQTSVRTHYKSEDR